MTTKRKAYSAVRWSTAAVAIRALLQIVQVMVLARLLAPEDFGLMAMVGVVLGFAGLFADMGINSAFVQRKDVTQEQRSSLFWLSVAVGGGLSLLLIAISPLLAGLFADERVTLLLMLSAPIFLIGSLGSQVRMAAEKELNFRPVVLLEVAAATIGFVLALWTAYRGWGVYALVLGAMATAVSGSAFAWLFIARGWLPMKRMRMEDIRPFLGFGGAIVMNNIVNQLHMSMDLMIGGRLFGAAQLGLYSVPRNIVLQIQMMVNPIITRVGFPLIAQMQHDLTRVRTIYLKTMNMTASINAPLYMGMVFFAPEVVAVALGGGWQEAPPLLRILALWGLFRSIGNPVGNLLFGLGRPDLALKWNIGLLFVVPPALWLGSQYGAEGMAWALLTLASGLFIPGWYILVRPLSEASLSEYSIAALRPLLLSLLSMMPAYLIVTRLDGDVLRLLAAASISATIYLAISYRANGEWFGAMVELLRRSNNAGPKI